MGRKWELLRGMKMPYSFVMGKVFLKRPRELWSAGGGPRLISIKGEKIEPGKKNCLFIHGLLCPICLFEEKGSLIPFLKDRYDNILYYDFPSLRKIRDNALGLYALLEEAGYLDPDIQFDIFGFSLGGLAARVLFQKKWNHSLNRYHVPNINRLVCMCTCHEGACPYWVLNLGIKDVRLRVAPFIAILRNYFPVFGDLFPGEFLTKLNAFDETEEKADKVLNIAGVSLAGHDGLVPWKSAFSFIGEKKKFEGEAYNHFEIFNQMETNGVGRAIDEWLASH